MKKTYKLILLAIVAPSLMWAQVSFTLTSNSFYLTKRKPTFDNTSKTTLTIEVAPKSKGKWVATGNSVQYIAKPNPSLQIKEPLLLKGEKDLPQAVAPQKIIIKSHPNADNLHLNVDLGTPTFSIAVYDLIGKPLFKGNYKNIKDKEVFIPVDQFASGKYFLKVEWEGKSEMKSFSLL